MKYYLVQPFDDFVLLGTNIKLNSQKPYIARLKETFHDENFFVYYGFGFDNEGCTTNQIDQDDIEDSIPFFLGKDQVTVVRVCNNLTDAINYIGEYK